MEKNNRPPFIYRGGGMMMHSPFEQQDSLLFGFFVKGDASKLQRLCDQCLNAVSGDRYYFKPLTHYALLSFTRINKDFSLYPQDREKGWGSEIDTSIWIPVGQYSIQNGSSVLERVHWFTPYIWVDHPMTVLNGREIFGYPKYMGEFQMPDSPLKADCFTLDVNAFKVYSKQSESALHRLLEVNRAPSDGLSEDLNAWGSALEFSVALFDGLRHLGENAFFEDMSLLKQMLGGLNTPYLPQLFLKQFPDGGGVNAVYQALTTSRAPINGFHGAGFLPGDYTLMLHEFASEPLAEDLGIVLGEQPIPLAFWMHFDFAIEPAKELVNNTTRKREKIVILGGGVSAMTAAFELTSQPDWQSKYDITLYQMGWRVGGKGASGRNKHHDQRIEEHGLHIWFGFYENAFKVMRDAYAELQRPPGAPLATWDEAFKPRSFVVLEEFIKAQWKTWPFEFPIKDGYPGDFRETLSLGKIVQTIYAWIKKAMEDLLEEISGLDLNNRARPNSNGFGALMQKFIDYFDEPLDAIASEALKVMHAALKLIDQLDDVFDGGDNHLFEETLLQLKHWLDEVVDDLLAGNDELRRLYILIDLGLAVLNGIFEDQIYSKGFDSINNLDFRDWLKKHGANEAITVNSAPVRALYDLVFAYEDGDSHKPNIEAGTCLRGALRILFCYEGGIMWEMQAGMGDVVFTPLYQVLKNRGVTFKFFHKVEDLIPDVNDPSRIGEIQLTQQVALNNGPDHYQPLVYVKGLGCWPSEPHYEQIVAEQAEQLQRYHINLESSWSDWPQRYQERFGEPLPQISLKVGKDFDRVIFGLSLGSVPVVCSQLLPLSPGLQACVDHVKTVVTQAYQVWMTPDLISMGWSPIPASGEQPVLTSFTEPLDTWASMGQLIQREDWPANQPQPGNLSYFCGVQPITNFPPFDNHAFPQQCADSVKNNAIEQLNNSIHELWKNAQGPDGKFTWGWLIDSKKRVGEQRFDAQYWRSNIDPSERYVQSVVNSTCYRLKTDETGFSNLYITGDWIKTGINAGCVEAAVQAGLQTSQAICGYPKIIKGEHVFEK